MKAWPSASRQCRRPLFDPGSIAAIHFADGRDAIDGGRQRPERLAPQAAAAASGEARCRDRDCAAQVRRDRRTEGDRAGALSPVVGGGAPAAARGCDVGRSAAGGQCAGGVGRVQGPVAQRAETAAACSRHCPRDRAPGTPGACSRQQASKGAAGRGSTDAASGADCTGGTGCATGSSRPRSAGGSS